jgi:recombination protein RecT
MAQAPALKEKLLTVRSLITQSGESITKALAGATDTQQFIQAAITTIRRNAALLQCDPVSLMGSLMEAASLGLAIDPRGLAYLVPYKSQCTLIIGYRGFMTLAYRSGQIRNIYAEVVYESDTFEVTLGTERGIRHFYDPAKERSGKIIAAYAVVQFKTGESHFEVIQPQEWVKRLRSSSAGAKGSGPWADWTEEMIKKTAIKKLCKYLDLSPQVMQAVVVDELADANKQDLRSTLDAYDVTVQTKADSLREKLGVVPPEEAETFDDETDEEGPEND